MTVAAERGLRGMAVNGAAPAMRLRGIGPDNRGQRWNCGIGWRGLAGAISAATLCLAGVCLAAAPPFGRYEVVIHRKPFGEAPRVPVAPAPPCPPTEPVSKSVKLVAITKNDGGMRVGFIDMKSNPPREYYLGIGEPGGEFKVLSADIEKEAAFIRRGAEEGWVQMQGEYQTGTSAPQFGAAGGGATVGVGRPGAPGPTYTAVPRRPTEPIRYRRVEPPKMTAEELEKHLQEYNAEIIRQHARGEDAPPPLPVELTPEMDAQLVEEGVLPPLEPPPVP